jgi:hypothetical protein
VATQTGQYAVHVGRGGGHARWEYFNETPSACGDGSTAQTADVFAPQDGVSRSSVNCFAVAMRALCGA